jgi:DNA polymerase III subunit delta
MKIYADQLEAQLHKSLQAAYWFAGDEPLQMREASDVLRQFSRTQGYTERELHEVDNNFDWQLLIAAGNSMSLFAEKKLIELRMRSSKLDDTAKKALTSYLENPGPDCLLLITSPKIEAASTKTQWFKKIEAGATVVQIYPVETSKLPQWINNRLKRHQLSADRDAIQLLAERTEGNLLAADQEFEKLSLVFGAGAHLTVDIVARSVADNARFNIFGLIDACLAGQGSKAVRTLHRMRDEGAETVMINTMLARELRNLASMADELARGGSASRVYQTHQVWANRQDMVGKAIKRINVHKAHQMLEKARAIDLASKGMSRTSPWILLEQLVLELSGFYIGCYSAPA